MCVRIIKRGSIEDFYYDGKFIFSFNPEMTEYYFVVLAAKSSYFRNIIKQRDYNYVIKKFMSTASKYSSYHDESHNAITLMNMLIIKYDLGIAITLSTDYLFLLIPYVDHPGEFLNTIIAGVDDKDKIMKAYKSFNKKRNIMMMIIHAIINFIVDWCYK